MMLKCLGDRGIAAGGVTLTLALSLEGEGIMVWSD